MRSRMARWGLAVLGVVAVVVTVAARGVATPTGPAEGARPTLAAGSGAAPAQGVGPGGVAAIGIGTATPEAPLHVVGSTPPLQLLDTYSDSLGALPLIFRTARGTPTTPTAVQAGDILGGFAVRGYQGTQFSGGRAQIMVRAAEAWTETAQGTYLQMATTAPGAAVWSERLRITAEGKVGIGTTAPEEQLHVAGDLKVDGNIRAKYQDVAEWVSGPDDLAAGTVVVLDREAGDGVAEAREAYDAAVARVVSPQPGLILGEGGRGKVLVAHTGRVRVKAEATRRPIRVGDLLVVSPTPGHAMASEPLELNGVPLHRPGTILGKALEPLRSGRGTIRVLLSLQ